MHASQLFSIPSLKQLGNELDDLAKATGWRSRSDGKIEPKDWIRAVLCCPLDKRAALRTLAFAIFANSGQDVSKQAVDNRLESGSKLLEQVLLCLLQSKLGKGCPILVGAFRRVLIQDSTSIALPACPGTRFPYRGDPESATATLRVQAVYELIESKAVNFQITPDIEKDRKRSVDIAALTGSGDLVVRDLGYINYKAFTLIENSGARFLSRLYGQSVVCDLDGEPLDLVELLRGKRTLDRQVLLGGKQFERQTHRKRPRVRLVATPVPEAVARERRRKLRAANPNVANKTLTLQNWSIYVTNALETELDVETADKVYRQRWNIEIIFRAWKSGLGIDEIPLRASEPLIMNLVLGGLIRAVLIQNFAMPIAQRHCTRKLSAYKMATLYPLMQLALSSGTLDAATIFKKLEKYACYGKRKRQSLPDRLEEIIQ